MRRKVVIAVQPKVELYGVPAWVAEEVQRRFPDFDLRSHSAYTPELDRDLADAEVFVGWSLPSKKFALARKLKWVHSLMTGVRQLCYPEMVASGVVMTNAATVHALPVAEHAWALILAAARRLPSAVRHQRQRQWAAQEISDEQPRMFELSGLTLGLFGLGAIGKEVARRGRAFGMRVIAVRRRPESGASDTDEVWGAAELPRLLAAADVLVLAAPSTPETRRRFGACEFARMKVGSLLVNVSRGDLVDEEALCAALAAGRPGFAALDVTAEEPLPATSPLWSAPNVLLTPHLSSVTDRLWPRHVELLSENLRRYLAGEPLLNVVDKAAGY